ncbi:uncharacterized protein [Periplaneta americana]|uniref:uncharacterized protein n=1 Tax=Periplaneta americana TaxID=6978 RepID=UPI0037E86DAD
MSIDMESSEVKKWKEEATKEQQEYFEFLGKCGLLKYKPSDYNNLKRKIGYAIFGTPTEEPNEISNDFTGYPKKQLNHINAVFDLIKEQKKKHNDKLNIWVSFLFVSGKVGNDHIRIPLIRMPESDSMFKRDCFIFIDSCPRVYKRWQDYLDNNRLPDCVMCYPRNGIYSESFGSLQLDFGISPAGKIGMKVVQGFDIAGTIVGMAAAGVGIAALFVPIAWPIAATALAATVSSGGYAAGRSIHTLVDRGTHKQSIGLDNAESRNCWLGIGGSVIGIASGGAVAAAAKMAQAGETVALAGQIAMKSVTATSCIVNALGVANGLANIVVKVIDAEPVSSLDIFQFSSSILFFTNSVISTHQAHTLINSIGRSGTGEYTGTMTQMMSRISKFAENTKNTFTGVVELSQYEGLTGFVIGSSSIMNSPSVQQSFLTVCKWIYTKFVEITKCLLKGVITMAKYMYEVGCLLNNLWESWNKEIDEVVEKICKAFGVKHWSDIIIEGSRILTECEPSKIREIAGTIISETRAIKINNKPVEYSDRTRITAGINASDRAVEEPVPGPSRQMHSFHESVNEETQTALSGDEIFNIQAKFVELQHCKSLPDFLRYMKFVCKFVKAEVDKERNNYDEMLRMVREYSPDVNIEDFNKKYGISGNPDSHFFHKVLNKFTSRDGDGFFMLKLAYDSENACMSAQEQENERFCENEECAFDYFYNKTGLAPNGFLNKDQFCELATELTEHLCDEFNVTIEENGNTSVLQINGGQTVIAVQSYLEGGKVSGIVCMHRSAL